MKRLVAHYIFGLHVFHDKYRIQNNIPERIIARKTNWVVVGCRISDIGRATAVEWNIDIRPLLKLLAARGRSLQRAQICQVTIAHPT